MARMVEMDKLYQMFQRPVRDLAQEEDKQLNMVVSGGETKIDKTIFEIITDPLMHMIRNAVSHGIETVAERTALGKPPAGALILSARHEGNSIILQIEDDGRGMDPLMLRKAAADKGFMSEAEARSLTDAEAVNLIFRPGFSTAAAVGKISGRGVGMDVVSTHLARINGRIEIKTEKGVGTKFVIRLPLTLAIAQALIVKLKDQEMAVPMNLVEETTRFSYKDIQRAAGEEMVSLRGALLRLLKLNDLLGTGKFPKKDDTFRHPTLILGMAERRIALMVEEITGREEIVVKSLGDYLKGVKLFSGATISGEGDVRLIINVASLFGDEGIVASQAVVGAAREAPQPEPAKRKPKVLIVDDSISIRKYVQRFLDRAGYEVEVAPDGMEALNVMGRIKFDAVITDLEMPVMHGYDLLAEMRKSADLKNIPVIVLTSRAGDKHRQKALEMGAKDYLVKPFEEQEMLAAIKKLLSGAALAGRA
jgi:two-component system chemotaxis sensor kinase CheA